ncbi:MAG: hypothetical protein QGF09_09435, partial [Rhodospirillales bacterium]|nr:hypothetical protein [Rhodospirillales bacterium]
RCMGGFFSGVLSPESIRDRIAGCLEAGGRGFFSRFRLARVHPERFLTEAGGWLRAAREKAGGAGGGVSGSSMSG